MTTIDDSFDGHDGTSRTDNRRSAEWFDGWTLSVVCSPGRGTAARHYRLTDPLIHLDRRNQPGATTIRVDDRAITRGAVSLRLHQGRYELEDAGSRNPVRVNGTIVRRALLAPNDVVRIGNTVMVIDRDDATRGAWRGHDLITERVDALAEQLLLFDATMSSQCRFDAGLIEPLYRCVTIWTPGPMASRTIAAWVAEDDGAEVFTLDGGEAGVIGQIEQAPIDALLVLDGLDDRVVAHGPLLHQALEARIATPGAGRVLLMVPNRLHDALPASLEQIVALLADFEMYVPSLAQRRSDLLRALLKLIAATELDVSADFAEHVLCHAWPGELAELRRTANRLRTFLRREGVLKPTHLPPAMRKKFVQQASSLSPLLTFKAVCDAAFEHEGNMTEVARSFGYSRTYFYKLLKDSNIDPKDVRRHYRRAREQDASA